MSEDDRKFRRHPEKVDIYTNFILWFAMPTPERMQLGIDNQTQFAKYYNISERSLTRWKDRPDFEDRVDKIQLMWGKEKTADVIQGIYRAAVKGNPMSQLLWLQYFKKFNPKQEIVHTIKFQMAPSDLRFVIEGMPQEYKQKFYGYITEIIDTAVALRNSGRLEDGNAPTVTAEDEILDEADNNAQDVPDAETRAISSRHPSSLRPDLEREVFQGDYKGAARWW